MINYDFVRESYIDNIFNQHRSILCEKDPRSLKSWDSVLSTLDSFHEETIGHKFIRNDIVKIGDIRTTVDSVNGLDKLITDNIYNLSLINKNVAADWKIVKEALERYVFYLESR